MTNFLTYILILIFTFTSSVNACYPPTSPNTYTDSLWINGQDTSLGNWSVDNNSSYVIGNTIDWSKVENRDNLDPITITFLVGAAIAAVGAYKGGEAKAIADAGYIGNDEYMRPSGEHISSEDLKTNLKIYGTMDIGGNLLMGIAPFLKDIKGGIEALFKRDARNVVSLFDDISKSGSISQPDIITVSRDDFKKFIFDLKEYSNRVNINTTYPGRVYNTPVGDIGLRLSKSGATIDLFKNTRKILNLNYLKIHYK